MRSFTSLIVLAAAFTFGASSSAAAQAKSFKIDGTNKVQFVSKAPLETFTGTTSTVAGIITVDPNAIAGAKAELRVEVASIRTNIELRDEHLASDTWLDAKKFPNAQLVLTSVSGAEKLKPNDVTEVTIKGKFTIHGVTKDITTKAKVRYTPGGDKPDTLHILASFTVKLEDHKVSIPSIVSLKVSPDIVVNVDLHASAQ